MLAITMLRATAIVAGNQPHHPMWENVMVACLIFGACALGFAVVSLIGHPRRSMPMRKGTREWLGARQGPPALVLAVLLFLTAAVAAIVR